MIPGVLGFSLLFELIVFYFAWNILFTQTPKHWVYAFFGVVIVVYTFNFSPAQWADLFSGHFDILWQGVFAVFGFR